MIRLTRNPQGGTYKKPDGYTDLGWQVYSGNCDEIKKCQESGHKVKSFDNSIHLNRGTEHIYTCDECKYIYHIDSSD